MAGSLRLYLRLVGASFRSQLQYRGAFLMGTAGQFLITGLEIFMVWALFARFKTLAGWTLPEIALLYGMVNVSFAVAEGAGRGFDNFAGMVRSGRFDLVLVRPRTTVLQVAGAEFQLRRLGVLAQGALPLVWALVTLPVAWDAVQIATLAGALAGGACLFAGLMVCQATVCFWTIESLEVFAIVTHGGAQTGQYPVVVYREWFRRAFTYVVPLAAVTYFPVVALLDRTDPLGTARAFQRLAPLLGVAFLAASLLLWRVGVRHYRSTGS